MTWGAILLALFLVLGLRDRKSQGVSLFPALLASAAVLAVVYVNLGKI